MCITILLTCTVNTQPHISWLQQRDSNERLKMYLDIIIEQLIYIKPQKLYLRNLMAKFPRIMRH